MIDERIVMCGTGIEAERFIFANPEIFKRLDVTNDNPMQNSNFHGLPIQHFRLEDVVSVSSNPGGVTKIVFATEFDEYVKYRNSLRKKGFIEGRDFTWYKFVSKKIIVFNVNCYRDFLEKTMIMNEAFRRRYAIYPIGLNWKIGRNGIDDEILSMADVYIHQDIKPDTSIGYKMSDEYILPRLKKECICICVPNFYNTVHFLFPFQGRLLWNSQKVFGMYENYIFEEAYLKNIKCLKDIKEFFCCYEYSPNVLDELYEKFINHIRRRENAWDIKLINIIENSFRKNRLFLDLGHVTDIMKKRIYSELCSILEVPDTSDTFFWNYDMNLMPLLNSIRDHFKLEYIGENAGSAYADRLFDDIEDYICSYWLHRFNCLPSA